MQWDVVKNGIDPGLAQFLKHPVAYVEIRQEHVIEMAVMLTVRRNDRTAERPALFQFCKRFMVLPPDGKPLPREGVSGFELRPQKGRGNLAGQIRGANIYPTVFIDMATEELLPVGSFLADNLGALNPAGLIDEQRTAFPGDHILGFVEADYRESAKTAKGTAFVQGTNALRGILNN
jgi:hypothetical protein